MLLCMQGVAEDRNRTSGRLRRIREQEIKRRNFGSYSVSWIENIIPEVYPHHPNIRLRPHYCYVQREYIHPVQKDPRPSENLCFQ
jgi:hypothetical protein